MSSEETTKPAGDLRPAIRRAPYQVLVLYEVTEEELRILATGSPESIFLNFSIFLLSAAITLTVSLLTSSVDSVPVFVLFAVCMVVGYVLGALLLILWYRTRSSVSECIAGIRKRLPAREGLPEPDSVVESGEP